MGKFLSGSTLRSIIYGIIAIGLVWLMGKGVLTILRVLRTID